MATRKQTQFKVTEERVNEAIKGKPTFTMLPSGKTMVCEVTLANGFTVLGFSAVVDPRNFNAKLGKQYSFEDAKRKIWEVLGYEVQNELHIANLAAAAVKKAAKKAAVKKPAVKRVMRTRKAVQPKQDAASE